ncbi:phospholipid scramblase-related protein [Kineosporia babensis]|uniref:Scramblase n=1 Tax=Kineosporia babensis TaxID=499548 RepID=A0A9X1STS7_9ACTN|nr:phospholipid scramblase-related protein [Kineosporia babensis]MCD5311651.1 hypothetical protein [Kineosporia babensis]
MTDQGNPIWGTPEPSGSAPEWGNPTPSTDAPAWGTPGGEAPPPPAADEGRLTSSLEAALFNNAELEVLENAAMFGEGGYTVHTPQHQPVASLSADTSAASMFFGGLVTSRQVFHDADGVIAAELQRSGSLFNDGTYELYDAQGLALGSISREFALFSSRLRILCVTGRQMLLSGASWVSSEFEVIDAADETVLATVQRLSNGMFSGTHHYPIQFGPEITVLERFLVVTAAICLDHVQDKN